ncbi:DNA polymerase III subunit delta' [Pontibacillus yanchengensis]|uniref:DNA polymerase III subunit delta n=1 Tax=Pontibacillus yanchengensis Y32 TaxID=1385514 RepID=A0A0A2TAS0_9BACI|nr:DNA polymerase III subunit delta' [Pontibacillus yanchengensis]KGP71523.1 DNA polymerase III subunit delta' [Pontibacillus yanchengensis Y32]
MKTWTEMQALQPTVSKMLTNSIKKDRVSHAYLFQGSRGTGKLEMSLLFAKSFFCSFRDGVEPCQNCKDCNRIESGNHPDVHVIQPEGQSIKKEQILHLQKEFTYTGLESNQKVYIVEDADKMTANASNRLLKFLEEPSRQTIAMLLTENGQSLLDTIRSRCQILAFQPLNPENITKKLMDEGLPESTARLMSALTNNLQDAIDMSNDEWFAKARKLVVQLMEVLQDKPSEALLFINNQWMSHFKDRDMLDQGLDLLMLWFKDIVYEHIGNENAIVYIKERERIQTSSYHWSKQKATNALTYILEAKRKLFANVHPTLVMEQLTLQIQR